MNKIYPSRMLLIYPAALGIWLILSSVTLIWVDVNNATLAIALVAITSTIAVTNLFPFAGWIVASLGSLAYLAFLIWMQGISAQVVVPMSVGILALLGTAFFGALTASRLGRVNRQLDHDRKIIQDLRIRDPKTGLVKFLYARQLLKSEITRSQRYKKDLSLVLARIGNWDDLVASHSADELEDIQKELSNILTSGTRAVDIPFSDGNLGVILPETSSEGAQTVANRLVDMVARRLQVPLQLGLANFPHDAVIEEELIRAAEAALQLSVKSGQPIVNYVQVRKDAE